MKKNINCSGCGFELQTMNQNELGFIPKISENEEKIHYCKRCYGMIFRNEAPEIFLDDQNYWDLFKSIVKEKNTYVLIIDLFNIEGTIIPKMIEELKNEKIILVLNKRDLLPKLVSDEKIIQNVVMHEELKKLNIVKAIITSSAKKYNIDVLLECIKKHKSKNTYLVGCANVGKSSILNALINSVLGENKEHIATSYFSGTTLGLIKIPLDEKYDLIDTPGIINTNDINNTLEKKTLEIIFPKKEVRPVTYQLDAEQSLFITGFFELDYIAGEKQGMTVYASNEINIHRTKYINSPRLREEHLGNPLLAPPSHEELKAIEFKENPLHIHPGNFDIVVNGLCWINIKNKQKNSLEFKLTAPKNVKIKVRKALI